MSRGAALNYVKLRKFVRENGEVWVFRSGKERKLENGEPDIIDLVEKAEKFRFGGKFYTKNEFERLIDSSN